MGRVDDDAPGINTGADRSLRERERAVKDVRHDVGGRTTARAWSAVAGRRRARIPGPRRTRPPPRPAAGPSRPTCRSAGWRAAPHAAAPTSCRHVSTLITRSGRASRTAAMKSTTRRSSSVTVMTAPGLAGTPPTSTRSALLLDHFRHVVERGREVPGQPRTVERVRGPVDDRSDEHAVRCELAVAQPQRAWPAGAGATSTPPTPGPRPAVPAAGNLAVPGRAVSACGQASWLAAACRAARALTAAASRRPRRG